MIRIEFKNKGMVGLQRIVGYVNNYDVISLSDGILENNKHKWMVSGSATFPSNIVDARLQNECISRVFQELDKFNE